MSWIERSKAEVKAAMAKMSPKLQRAALFSGSRTMERERNQLR